MTEASDDLLLVQLVGFELHAPHRLHDAVILQALIPGQLRLQRGTLLQTVQVAFLQSRNKKNCRWNHVQFLCLHSSSLVFAHLDVKGRLRSEVSEGAGNHDSGALVTHTHLAVSDMEQKTESSTHSIRAALLSAAGGGGGATGGGSGFRCGRPQQTQTVGVKPAVTLNSLTCRQLVGSIKRRSSQAASGSQRPPGQTFTLLHIGTTTKRKKQSNNNRQERKGQQRPEHLE